MSCSFEIYCPKEQHNKKIIQISLDQSIEQNYQTFYCYKCNLSQKKKLVNIDYFNSKVEKFIENHNNLTLQLNNIKEKLTSQIDSIQKRIQLIKEKGEEWIKNKSFKNLEELSKIMSKEAIFLNENDNQFNFKIDDDLLDLENRLDFQNHIKSQLSIGKVEFNHTNQLLICGSNNMKNKQKYLQIFETKNNGTQLDLISNPEGHNKIITSICSCNSSDSFFSSDLDFKIIFWQKNNDDKHYQIKQELNGHDRQINHLIINNTDDLLISGDDYLVVLWNKKSDQWCKINSIENENAVYSLSVNNDFNKLLISFKDALHIISLNNYNEQEQNQRNTKQIKINEEQTIFFAYFLNDTAYLVYSFIKQQNENQLRILTVDDKDVIQQEQILNIQDQNSLKQLNYFQKTQILVGEHQEFIKIYSLQQQELKIIQQIPIKNPVEVIKLSDNGKLIAYVLNGKIKLKEIQYN